MVNLRRIEKQAAANERVEIVFYKVIEREKKRMLKPLNIKTEIPLAMVKAILDNTIIDAFYERLSKDLIARGVEKGTLVEIRANFSKSNAGIDPAYKGLHTLCEVKI